MKITCRDGNEGAASGMRGASLESKFCEQFDEPVHNAVRAHGAPAAGTNDGAARITAAPEDQQRSAQMWMQRDTSARPLLCDGVLDDDQVPYPPLRFEHH